MEENEILTGEQEESVVNSQNAEDAEQGSEGEKSPEAAERERQSREDNRRYQAARQAGDRAGYERAIREMNERIARSGMRAPDGGIIEDIDGLEKTAKSFRASAIRARAEKEGRTVEAVTEEEENREFVRRAKAREQAEEKERQSREAREKFVKEDMDDFRERYPEEDLGALMKNQTFIRFAGSRLGKEPLADLFEDYRELKISAGATGGDKAERATGSGGGKGSAVRLTASQQRDLDEWNRNYPSMKMTAKEFLERG